MKNLYQEFNRISVDPEMEPLPVSDVEKARIKRKVLKEKKKKIIRRNIFAVAISFAILLFCSTAVSITNPVLAAKLPVIGHVFEFFNKEKQHYYIFDEYPHFTTDIGITKEINGIQVTITDAVFDGETITIAYRMKSDRDLGYEPALVGFSVVEGYQYDHKGGTSLIEKIGEYEYAGLYMIYLMKGKRSEQVHVTWEAEEIWSWDLTEPIVVDWSFQFTLETLDGKEQRFEQLMSEDHGVKVTLDKIVTTPISTSFYFWQEIDPETVTREDSLDIRYRVADNLGNEYNVLPNMGYGDSQYKMISRITASVLHEEATELIITPYVNRYYLKDGNWERVAEPYLLEALHVKLEK